MHLRGTADKLVTHLELGGSIPIGTPVLVRYLDHVRFESADARQYKPWPLEMIGWLDYEDKDCLRIVCERFAEPTSFGNARVRSTGISIVKNTILELKRLRLG